MQIFQLFLIQPIEPQEPEPEPLQDEPTEDQALDELQDPEPEAEQVPEEVEQQQDEGVPEEEQTEIVSLCSQGHLYTQIVCLKPHKFREYGWASLLEC